jgi:hypothetical protein
MARYAFHDLTLDARPIAGPLRKDLDRLLNELSWERVRRSPAPPSLRLSVRLDRSRPVPTGGREVLRADGFRGLEHDKAYCLTDGASLLRIVPREGRASARLAPSFRRKTAALRRSFWAFGLLKLLRARTIFGLHAAGLVTGNGDGVLVVGDSGCGKSTLTLALLGEGWRCLSDDAVLLRPRPDGIEALALRRHLYENSGSKREEGRRRRVATVAEAKRAASCRPCLLVFPEIVARSRSVLRPIDRGSALQRLLAQSGPQLLDREETGRQLDVLKRLLDQSVTVALRAGRDVRNDPSAVARLLLGAIGESPCRASSSS